MHQAILKLSYLIHVYKCLGPPRLDLKDLCMGRSITQLPVERQGCLIVLRLVLQQR